MTDASSQLYKALLENVRSKLQTQKLTQAEIGKALGIKQSAISYLLSGRTKLTLEQFLSLSNLVGEKSYKLIADAEAALTETRPLPAAMEEVMLKSPLHFLLYVAACRPVMAGDFVSAQVPLTQVQKAFEELCRVDLLRVRDGQFLQTEPNVYYDITHAAGIRKRFDSLRDIHRHCQNVWMKNMDNKEYRSRRFNHFNVSYLTNAQFREVLELFWRAFEKINSFEKENSAAQYSGEKYQLWNTHMMLMTPFEG